MTSVSPKTTTALRLDDELMAAMRQIKDTVGIPITTQIEMAVRDWLSAKHGIVVKKQTDRKRPASRKRS